MPWVRLDDGFADHPKVEAAGPLAAWLHVAALCYSARHLTDGHVPKAKARRLVDIPSPAKHITALVKAGLWREDGDDYVIHDYLDYQPSRAEVEKDREAARDRMAAARAAKRKRSGEQPPNVPANSERTSEEVRVTPRSDNPVPSRPDPTRESDLARGQQVPPPLALVRADGSPPPAAESQLPLPSSSRRQDGLTKGYTTDFLAFWQVYPRKEGKADAAEAWRKALGRAGQREISDGLRRAIGAWQAEGRQRQHIPHAATWLNHRRWEDTHDEAPLTRVEPKGFAGIRAALQERGSA